jgi:hypothetical protein
MCHSRDRTLRKRIKIIDHYATIHNKVGNLSPMTPVTPVKQENSKKNRT